MSKMPSPAAPPNLAGTWVPAEPARSNVLFNNGLGWVSGNGSFVIEQRMSAAIQRREGFLLHPSGP